MKPYKRIVVVLSAVGLMGLGVAAYSDDQKNCDKSEYHQHDGKQRGGERGDESDGPRFGQPHFGKLLDLTEAQKNTLKDARTAQGPAQRELHEKIRTARDALVKAGDAKVSDTELNQLALNLATLTAQTEVARIKAHQQLLSILTPGQNVKTLGHVTVNFIAGVTIPCGRAAKGISVTKWYGRDYRQ